MELGGGSGSGGGDTHLGAPGGDGEGAAAPRGTQGVGEILAKGSTSCLKQESRDQMRR